MPTAEVLVRHDPCAWLPVGATAEVVLARGADAPAPTAVVRLLATGDRGVLVVPRADGDGLDLPTRPAGPDPRATLAELASDRLGGTPEPALLGYVRNHVPDPPASYPWPAPLAHFAVWHLPLVDDTEALLPWSETAEHLAARHWWPLLAHVR